MDDERLQVEHRTAAAEVRLVVRNLGLVVGRRIAEAVRIGSGLEVDRTEAAAVGRNRQELGSARPRSILRSDNVTIDYTHVLTLRRRARRSTILRSRSLTTRSRAGSSLYALNVYQSTVLRRGRTYVLTWRCASWGTVRLLTVLLRRWVAWSAVLTRGCYERVPR